MPINRGSPTFLMLVFRVTVVVVVVLLSSSLFAFPHIMPVTWDAAADRHLLLSLLAINLSSLKFDYAGISKVCGTASRHGVQHRFRVLKREANELLQEYTLQRH
jgi:hypothetical protein